MANPAFFAQYWLLAVKYSRTAYEIPFIVEGQTAPIKGTFCTKKSTDWTMLFLNIILASANGYFYARTHTAIQHSDAFLGCYFLSVLIDSILILISGLLLLDAVFKIRKSLGDMDGDINVRQLILHATSFILFAVGFLVQRSIIIIECSHKDVANCPGGYPYNS